MEGGACSGLLPHVLLGVLPILRINFPPFVIVSCKIQGLSKGLSFKEAD
jgi:hypothetical protein